MSPTSHRPWRTLPPGGRCRVRVWDRASGETRTVLESTDRLLEAPNWGPDGRLLLNADGRLWWLAADGRGRLQEVPTEGLPPVNNDHVLTPDGRGILASADGGHIWWLPAGGGTARRLTAEDGGLHYLHAIRPDGELLAYTHVTGAHADGGAGARIRVCAPDGSGDRELVGDPGPSDGPEWTADGSHLLLNTEVFSERPGHAQIARIEEDGSGFAPLTADDRVNWFPHPSPDGTVTVYLSYPPGVVGHPADERVELRLVEGAAWDAPRTLVALDGGQGTINVPSWAPDGSAFAFVDYPAEADRAD